MPALRHLLSLSFALLVLASGSVQAAGTVRLDYADYSPASLVVKKFGWVEAALRGEGATVQWVRAGDSRGALAALTDGRVDLASALSGDALQARAAGAPVKAVYVYAHPAAGSYGFINVSEGFLSAHPRQVELVVAAYERARHWIVANPEEAAKLISAQSGVSLAAAREQLSRADFTVSRPGPAQSQALREAAMAAAAAQPGQVQAANSLLDDGPIRAALLNSRQQDGSDSRLALGW
ncbi:MAG: transporter substrate-binding protein [Betaproteobacteria bacterium]|nr:transporter substrate-binding protein [Betaproteobacteria bacterium]